MSSAAVVISALRVNSLCVYHQTLFKHNLFSNTDLYVLIAFGMTVFFLLFTLQVKKHIETYVRAPDKRGY